MPSRTYAFATLLTVAALGIGLSGCASSAGGRADPTAIAQAMAGPYDNSAQWAQMGESFRASAGVSPVTVRFVFAKAPALGPAVIYEEWRAHDGDTRPLRQRVWIFRSDGAGVRVDRFGLSQPAQFVGAGGDAFFSITRDDLTPMGLGCGLALTITTPPYWTGQTRPKACRPDGEEPVNTRITSMPTGVLYAETRGDIDPDTVSTPFDLRRAPGRR
jgi:hypothetical protein